MVIISILGTHLTRQNRCQFFHQSILVCGPEADICTTCPISPNIHTESAGGSETLGEPSEMAFHSYPAI